MATAVQKITLSSSRDIPFNKLILISANVRRVKAGVSIEELAEHIARRTLLQSLNVRSILDADSAETGILVADRCASPFASPRPRRLASRNVSLHRFDIAEPQAGNPPVIQKLLDVRFDAALVHRQGGRPYRPPALAENAPCVGFQEIPVAALADRRGAAVGLSRDRGGDPLEHREQLLVGGHPGLLDGHQSVAADDQTAGPTFRGAILNHEALQSRGHHLHAEATELTIPRKTFSHLDSNLGRLCSATATWIQNQAALTESNPHIRTS